MISWAHGTQIQKYTKPQWQGFQFKYSGLPSRTRYRRIKGTIKYVGVKKNDDRHPKLSRRARFYPPCSSPLVYQVLVTSEMRGVERREKSSSVWLVCYLLPTLENSTSPTQNPLQCILQSMRLPVDSSSEILTTANYDFCLLCCTQRDCTTSGANNSPASILKQTQTMGFEHAGSRTYMCCFIWHT